MHDTADCALQGRRPGAITEPVSVLGCLPTPTVEEVLPTVPLVQALACTIPSTGPLALPSPPRHAQSSPAEVAVVQVRIAFVLCMPPKSSSLHRQAVLRRLFGNGAALRMGRRLLSLHAAPFQFGSRYRAGCRSRKDVRRPERRSRARLAALRISRTRRPIMDCASR
ncbi:hypothetical protein GQ53DRAFT_154048 [Thozetella sp. PMI_491]|nr:hypothetical protein GQ53DRAFT_154048 [Thozetella sp. PMI_491]